MKKKLSRFKRIKLTKRKEFVLVTVLLTIGFVITQLVDTGLHFFVLSGLTLASFVLSALTLREGLKGIKWFTLLLLPPFFTASLGLFYFLLPVRWLTRLPIAILYALGLYAILLVENIYNVAVSRSIQLLRVAHAVGFLITLATLFFLFNIIFSFRFPAYINFISMLFILFPLVFQVLWAIELTERVEKRLVYFSIFSSLMVAQIAFVISFWPLTPILASLFLTSICYTFIGIGQHHFAERLFQKNIMEYVRVFVIIFILILLTTRYR